MSKTTALDLQILGMYLGCEVECYFPQDDGTAGELEHVATLSWVLASGYDSRFEYPVKVKYKRKPDSGYYTNYAYPVECIKPILRSFADMTEEEAQEIALLSIDNGMLDIKLDEIEINLAYGDGGLNVDLDVAIIIEISCRCYEGHVVIRTNGDLELWDNEDSYLKVFNQAKIFRYLLSKGFCLDEEWFTQGLAVRKEGKNG